MPRWQQVREVVWAASEVNGFRHGYAETILQGPGPHAGGHLPLPHAPRATGSELRGADPAAGKHTGAHRQGNGAGRWTPDYFGSVRGLPTSPNGELSRPPFLLALGSTGRPLGDLTYQWPPKWSMPSLATVPGDLSR
jgi:hypothetical protein